MAPPVTKPDALVIVSGPEPSAKLWPSSSWPLVKVVPPEYVLAPVRLK